MKLNTTTILIGGAVLYFGWRLWKQGSLAQLVNGPAPAQGNGTATGSGAFPGVEVILV